MDLNNDKQLEDLICKLKEIGARIVRYQGRVGDKVKALEYCRMQYCVWGLAEYEKLDKIYTGIIRKITRNLGEYPTKPIWALAIDGGLGAQSLLDYMQRSKLRLLLKNIEKNDNTGKAFEGLVSRVLRLSGSGGLRWRPNSQSWTR